MRFFSFLHPIKNFTKVQRSLVMILLIPTLFNKVDAYLEEVQMMIFA